MTWEFGLVVALAFVSYILGIRRGFVRGVEFHRHATFMLIKSGHLAFTPKGETEAKKFAEKHGVKIAA